MICYIIFIVYLFIVVVDLGEENLCFLVNIDFWRTDKKKK